MRSTGLASMGFCVAAVTVALHTGARQPLEVVQDAPEPTAVVAMVEAPPLAARTTVSAQRATPPEDPPGATATAPAREKRSEAPRSVTPQERPPRVAPPPPPPPRREYRRRYRNRYPGRIPTPAEWQPPEGPVKIALQAGHWRADEAPRELSGLRDNGTSWRGTPEWRANLTIAERAAEMLTDLGYEVDILPAVVPPDYRAHLFISIHADGSNDPAARGYRVSPPRRDATGRAHRIAELLAERYGEVTGLPELPTTTRRMRNYYAFNYRRYEHALHPMTIGVIIETGFLTSARDRRVIMDAPERAARGIVEAVTAFSETPAPAPDGAGG